MTDTLIKLRRSAVPGKTPTDAQMQLGEVAINTYDGKMFFKQSSTSNSILEVATTSAPTLSNVKLIGSLTANNSTGNNGQILFTTGDSIYWGDAGAIGGGESNLSYSANSSTATIFSDTGTDATILAANSNIAGLVSTLPQVFSGQKYFIDGIGIGASNTTSKLEIVDTWNNAGTSFTHIKTNITDTASASTSKLIDLQVGSNTMFNVAKTGMVTAVNFQQTIGGSGFYTNGIFSTANYFNAYSISSGNGGINTNAQLVIKNGPLILADAGSANGIYLYRDGANILAQRNGTAAQTFNIYNTYTDASNYERAKFGWSSNTFVIGTESAGTGVRRNINLNYTTSIDGNSRTNVPALSITNIGAGTGGISLGALQIGHQQDWTRLTALYTANKGLSYSHAGTGVSNQGAHRFTTDDTFGSWVGANGSVVDILAPSTISNIFQCRQADGTVVLNIGYNGSVTTGNTVTISSEATTLATTTKTQVASFSTVSFRSAKLLAQAYDSVTGEVQISELLVAHNGTTASATEYGVVFTGALPIVSYDVDILSGNVRLLATRTSTNSTQYKVSETLMVS